MSQAYHQRPSQLLNIVDEYAAFCLDEACALIINKISSGENLKFTGYNAAPASDDDLIHFLKDFEGLKD